MAKWIELPLDCSQCQKHDVGITRSGLIFQFHEYYSNAMQAVFLNCFGEEFRVWRLGQQFLTNESPMDIVRLIRLKAPETNSVEISDRGPIESRLCGAIRSAVDAHGPITRENANSVAKRIYGELKGIAREQRRNAEPAPVAES